MQKREKKKKKKLTNYKIAFEAPLALTEVLLIGYSYMIRGIFHKLSTNIL